MASKLTIGKIQVWAGIALVVAAIARGVYSFYPFGSIFGFLSGFNLSFMITAAILAAILILEGLANIAEL